MSAGVTRTNTPPVYIAWARSAARNGLVTASIYAMTAGQLHRTQGVGRSRQPFDRPGEDQLAAAWLSGHDEMWEPCGRHLFGAITHAVRTAAFLENWES